MKINITTQHTLTFAVQAFWNEEGGMGEATFKKDIPTLEEALSALLLANAAQEGRRDQTNWIITVDVETKVSKS